jgi:glycine cleavage system transcriptional repressor
MKKTVVLTGVGRDRVGIVAELAQVLFELGCNLLDSSMTLMRGEFALILMVELADGSSLAELERGLRALEEQLGMRIHIRELAQDELLESSNDTDEQNHFIVSVYGADKPGIVARVTRELATRKLNITDVQTKSTGLSSKVFLMILEVSAASSVSRTEVQEQLKAIGAQLDVDISVQQLDVVEL